MLMDLTEAEEVGMDSESVMARSLNEAPIDHNLIEW